MTGIPLGLMMVDTCPPHLADTTVDRLCRQEVNQEAYSYTLDIPVTSRRTNITYVNYHCATCNNDASSLYDRHISINCRNEQFLSEYNMTEFMSEALYFPGMWRWLRYIYASPEDKAHKVHREKITCFLEVMEFRDVNAHISEIGGRLCTYPKGICHKDFVGRRNNICVEQVRHCDPAWSDQLDVEKCQRYSQMMTFIDENQVETVYKNPHCAKCNFVNVSSTDLKCIPPANYSKCVSYKRGINFPPCFSVLMDFHAKPCHKETELWDPIHETCQKIFCGHLFKLKNGVCERDLAAYTVIGNSRLFDNSCPKTILHEHEYIPRKDGSVLVNATERFYKEGEFEVFNETKLLICNEHYLYTAGYTEAHQYLTVICLSISIIALVLHIAIFLSSARYRNLPGKNLFSLSCCLLIAHLLFLTGTRATSNYGFCVFLSATLHYFWLASFCWMNVMSIDVCRTFTSNIYRGESDGRRAYVLYSLYAWGIPALVVSLALIFDFLDLLPGYRPQYGIDLCWITNRYGLALFFLLPSGAVILENVVLFFVSGWGIYKQAKAARYANIRSQSFKGQKKPKASNGQKKSKASTGQKDNGLKYTLQNQHARKERIRLVLYLKLGLIQGLTWVMGIIAAFANVPALWSPFTIFNGLQGAFIFIGFDMKRMVWETVWESVTGKPWKKRKLSKDTRTTTTGRTSTSQTLNMSSKSYSYSDGEHRVNPSTRLTSDSRESTVKGRRERDSGHWRGASVRLTPPTRHEVRVSPQLSRSRKLAAHQMTPVSQSSDKVTEMPPACPQGFRNGDLRASVVKGKFDGEGQEDSYSKSRSRFGENEEATMGTRLLPDVTKSPAREKGAKPNLQRVVDLLQKLQQQSQSSLNLPDLVQQLLMRGEGYTDSECKRSGTLSKCKSFTEGTNPLLQEDQRKALAARLQLLEYSQECPTIHSLITSHAPLNPRNNPEGSKESNSVLPNPILPMDNRYILGEPMESRSSLIGPMDSRSNNTAGSLDSRCSSVASRHPSFFVNNVMSNDTSRRSGRGIDMMQQQQQQHLTREEQVGCSQVGQIQRDHSLLSRKTPTSQSFSQISQVALAATILQRATAEAREKRQGLVETRPRENSYEADSKPSRVSFRASESLV